MLSRRIVILTANELRHHYVAARISQHPDIKVLKTYHCGPAEGVLETEVNARAEVTSLEKLHLSSRKRIEYDMFADLVERSSHFTRGVEVSRDAPNDPEVVRQIVEMNPDVILVYGCCIIKQPLLRTFHKRILNVHLGLSPYYRGSGTNYWPLVNGEPEYVGCTFLYLDKGIDTGEIIHQMRPTIHPLDGPHQIGNRLIKQMCDVYATIAIKYEQLSSTPQQSISTEKVYKRSDYTLESVQRLYNNFSQAMLQEYMIDKEERLSMAPIIEQPELFMEK